MENQQLFQHMEKPPRLAGCVTTADQSLQHEPLLLHMPFAVDDVSLRLLQALLQDLRLHADAHGPSPLLPLPSLRHLRSRYPLSRKGVGWNDVPRLPALSRPTACRV